MKKYYVRCGTLCITITAESAMKAAVKAMLHFAGSNFSLDHTVYINHTGFDSDPKCTFDTSKVLKKAGFIFE